MQGFFVTKENFTNSLELKIFKNHLQKVQFFSEKICEIFIEIEKSDLSYVSWKILEFQ